MSARRRRPKIKDPVKRHTLTPPEGVPLTFEVASIGARFAAQLLDILFTLLFVISFLGLLLLSNLMSGDMFMIIAVLMFFGLRVPYYVITELMWNGQTLGKRLVKLRVVSSDGKGLSAYSVTVRNMMKEAEVFMPGLYLLASSAMDGWTKLIVVVWVFILLIVPIRSKRNQRLGDIIAGTYVVEIPKPVLLPDLAVRGTAAPKDRFTFQPNQLDHYGRYELQTLETLLQVKTGQLDAGGRMRHDDTVRKVAATIARRIDFAEAIARGREDEFLRAFYRAQRGYLENRKLFGDAREDKFHHQDNDR